MPDFSDTYNGIRPKSPKKLTKFSNFSLSTSNRGQDKQSKLQEKVEMEQRKAKVDACFKATPIKTPAKQVELGDRIKSEKKVTRALTVKLVSDERSVKREEFESAMREKERLKAEEAARLALEREEAEAEEVRKIRAASNFKATPIKHYRIVMGNVPERKLTVPQEPKL